MPKNAPKSSKKASAPTVSRPSNPSSVTGRTGRTSTPQGGQTPTGRARVGKH